MKAVVLTSARTMEARQVAEPKLDPGQVMVAPEYVGLCGTDQHVFLGEFEERVKYPAILGHEFCGKIVEAGAHAKDFQKGQRVVVDPVIFCGECPMCITGHANVCKNVKVQGLDTAGGLAQLVAVDASRVVPLPDSISPEHAAMAELYSVAVHAARITNIATGDTVVILGSGKLGLTLLDVMRHSGAKKIIVIDILDSRLERAKSIGADVIINARDEGPIAAVMNETDGLGADKVIEAIGTPAEIPGRESPMEKAIRMVRPAGQITAMGQPQAAGTFPWRMAVLKEVKILTSRLNLRDMNRAVALMAKKGMLHPEKIISHVVKPAEVPVYLEMMHSEPGKVVKAVVDMSKF